MVQRKAENQEARDFANEMKFGAECETRERLGGFTAQPIKKVTAEQVMQGECTIKITHHKKAVEPPNPILIAGNKLKIVKRKLDESGMGTGAAEANPYCKVFKARERGASASASSASASTLSASASASASSASASASAST